MRFKRYFGIVIILGTLVPSVYSQTSNIPVVDNSTDAPVVNRPTNVGAAAAPSPVVVPNNVEGRGNYAVAQTSPNRAPVPAGAVARPQGPGELLYQLELLQQEVQALRGIVEQQSYELSQMRIEQRDRYLDLDRRIAMAGQNTASSSGPSGEPGSVTADPKNQAPSPGLPRPATQSEKSAYQSAFELIRGKKYEQAIDALLKFTKDFPEGDYTGNAFYWLGEVYLVRSDRESALTAFGALLNQFPQHRKAADAKYKLGRIYRDLGEESRANELFEEVTREHSGTSAAKLAANELR